MDLTNRFSTLLVINSHEDGSVEYFKKKPLWLQLKVPWPLLLRTCNNNVKQQTSQPNKNSKHFHHYKFNYLPEAGSVSQLNILRTLSLELEQELLLKCQTTKALSNYKSQKAIQVVTSATNTKLFIKSHAKPVLWNLFYLAIDIFESNFKPENNWVHIWMLTVVRIMTNLIILSLLFQHVRWGRKNGDIATASL